jgi:hypothetical protein
MNYEKLVVDDMVEFAAVGDYEDLGRPNIAYLIKALLNENGAVHAWLDPSLMYRSCW